MCNPSVSGGVHHPWRTSNPGAATLVHQNSWVSPAKVGQFSHVMGECSTKILLQNSQLLIASLRIDSPPYTTINHQLSTINPTIVGCRGFLMVTIGHGSHRNRLRDLAKAPEPGHGSRAPNVPRTAVGISAYQRLDWLIGYDPMARSSHHPFIAPGLIHSQHPSC